MNFWYQLITPSCMVSFYWSVVLSLINLNLFLNCTDLEVVRLK